MIIPPTTPPVLKRRQNSESTRTGKIALAAPHGRRMPQLPAIELAYSFGQRSNSRVVGELANHLADSLASVGSQNSSNTPF
jgi:hypothetical protein